MSWDDIKRSAQVLLALVFASVAFVLVCYAVSALLQAAGFQ